jgi:DNA-binding PadR family transcriptional regulator
MELTLTIEGIDLTYKKALSEFQAGQIISYLNNTDSAVVTPEKTTTLSVLPGSTSPYPAVPMSTSPRGALTDYNATTNPQRIATFGYYTLTTQGKETFSIKEVRELFKKAGVSMPKNFSRDIREAVRMNYITDQGKDQYTITDKGIEALTEKFSTENSLPVKKKTPAGTKRKDSGKVVVREEISKLEIVPDLAGYPNYWDLTTKTQRVIWLLTFADTHTVEGLSPSEISAIGNRLKDNIPRGNVAAFTKESIKKRYIVQSGSTYKILKPGLDYLKSLGHGE